MKIAVLQRMLVSNPWNGLGLKVRLFSDAAKKVWDDAAKYGPVNPGAGLKRKISYERLVSREKWPDVTSIDVEMRKEGVDGARLMREDAQKFSEKDCLEPIETDDRTWAVGHWSKWLSVQDEAHTCPCCKKLVVTEVCLL